MLVAVLIGIMISIVVGVSLIPVITTSVSAVSGAYWYVNTTPTPDTSGWVSGAPTGLFALVNVLPYIFVAVILLGAVAWIGGQG